MYPGSNIVDVGSPTQKLKVIETVRGVGLGRFKYE